TGGAAALRVLADLGRRTGVIARAAVTGIGRRVDARVTARDIRRRHAARHARTGLAERRRGRTGARARAAVARIAREGDAGAPARSPPRRARAWAPRARLSFLARVAAGTAIRVVAREIHALLAARREPRGASRLARPVGANEVRVADVAARAAVLGVGREHQT